MQINDYGKLCTMMYEQLHPTADPQELAFYLSTQSPASRCWSCCAAADGS